MLINPVKLFLWTFRRNERDVVNLYNALSDVMRLATGGDMLNFGYWSKDVQSPLDSQKELCRVFADFADLREANNVVDVGSGLSAPAIEWHSQANLKITCLNINFNQLRQSVYLIGRSAYFDSHDPRIYLVNATSTCLPVRTGTADRVLALESAQHMKPFADFLSESNRILQSDGIFALALPVVNEETSITQLGLLSLTWSSEHYTVDYVKSSLTDGGFEILETKNIGAMVYPTLANYYIENRNYIRNKILSKYPSYVEKALFRSIVKMKQVSEKGVIDYIMIKCAKLS